MGRWGMERGVLRGQNGTMRELRKGRGRVPGLYAIHRLEPCHTGINQYLEDLGPRSLGTRAVGQRGVGTTPTSGRGGSRGRSGGVNDSHRNNVQTGTGSSSTITSNNTSSTITSSRSSTIRPLCQISQSIFYKHQKVHHGKAQGQIQVSVGLGVGERAGGEGSQYLSGQQMKKGGQQYEKDDNNEDE